MPLDSGLRRNDEQVGVSLYPKNIMAALRRP
jgi:hypothetical protein